jgi:transcriptional regulator with GAF, ATPase, and Fis domain
MSDLWHLFFEITDLALRSRVIAALTHAGVSTHALKLDMPCGPGIIFFSRFTASLCDLVREISRNGVARVLVVALSHSALHGGSTWDLLQLGASDVFSWDHSADPAREVAARFDRWDEVDSMVHSPVVEKAIVGRSPCWICLLRQIVEVARFTDAYVLIMGESGTGKELVARLIHELDPRPQKRNLIVLDCTTIVPELSGSEFFGHERGAFTGAVAPRQGAFALADQGTLFLDEIGELSPALQAELLRAVQERTYKRVGSNTWQKTEFRLISATNKDLLHEQKQGTFRRDLFYRIASWKCTLPPLRERTEDILPLANFFLHQLCEGENPPELDDTVREYLLNREYPGNIRDLKQLVSGMSYRHVGRGPITVGDIPPGDRPKADFASITWCDSTFFAAIRRAVESGAGLKEITQAAGETAIQVAFENADGNLQRAARKLGVTDRALQMRKATARRRLNGEEHLEGAA